MNSMNTLTARHYLGGLIGRNEPLPRRTLSHWLNKGLPHRRIGRGLVFNHQEIAAWVNAHKKGAYGI